MLDKESHPPPSLKVTRIITPKNAITRPIPFLLVMEVLKNKAPTRTTKSGVSAFNTPVSELLSCVCAIGNRKAGIKLPNQPVTSKFFTCVLLSCLILGRDNGSSKLAAATIR